VKVDGERPKTAHGCCAKPKARPGSAERPAGWVRKNPAPLWGSLLLQASCFMPGCEARLVAGIDRNVFKKARQGILAGFFMAFYLPPVSGNGSRGSNDRNLK